MIIVTMKFEDGLCVVNLFGDLFPRRRKIMVLESVPGNAKWQDHYGLTPRWSRLGPKTTPYLPTVTL